jgi:hypothetical protein
LGPSCSKEIKINFLSNKHIYVFNDLNAGLQKLNEKCTLNETKIELWNSFEYVVSFWTFFSVNMLLKKLKRGGKQVLFKFLVESLKTLKIVTGNETT